VSVVVPAYNSARTIGACMAGLARQQTEHAFEVLVVHSGSDDTCERARAALPTVRLCQLPARAIPPRARNVGAQQARGEILAFLDCDIYVAPDWIDQVVLAAARGFDLVCGSIENANPDSAVSQAEQLLMFKEFLPSHPEHPSWFALAGNTVLTRAAYERFGPLDEVRAAEDVIFSRRVIERGGRILFYPKLRVRHDNRRHLRPFLRNQLLVGRHTAMARRVVAFADSAHYGAFILTLPVAPLVKLGKVVLHACRYDRTQAWAVLRALPLLVLGACTYSVGMVLGAASARASVARPPDLRAVQEPR
jgi:glycosyltransferase involved in cell wall biosynthesis